MPIDFLGTDTLKLEDPGALGSENPLASDFETLDVPDDPWWTYGKSDLVGPDVGGEHDWLADALPEVPEDGFGWVDDETFQPAESCCEECPGGGCADADANGPMDVGRWKRLFPSAYETSVDSPRERMPTDRGGAALCVSDQGGFEDGVLGLRAEGADTQWLQRSKPCGGCQQKHGSSSIPKKHAGIEQTWVRWRRAEHGACHVKNHLCKQDRPCKFKVFIVVHTSRLGQAILFAVTIKNKCLGTVVQGPKRNVYARTKIKPYFGGFYAEVREFELDCCVSLRYSLFTPINWGADQHFLDVDVDCEPCDVGPYPDGD